MTETFRCAGCGGVWPRSDEDEARAEAAEQFPGLDVTDPEQAAIVCDDCYAAILAQIAEDGPCAACAEVR